MVCQELVCHLLILPVIYLTLSNNCPAFEFLYLNLKEKSGVKVTHFQN